VNGHLEAGQAQPVRQLVVPDRRREPAHQRLGHPADRIDDTAHEGVVEAGAELVVLGRLLLPVEKQVHGADPTGTCRLHDAVERQEQPGAHRR